MKITQIVVKEDRLFYGLGSDSKMYLWDYTSGEWKPYWATDGKKSAKVLNVFNDEEDQYQNSAK